MPMLRDTILRLMPASWRDAAIAESRQWATSCRSCGAESTVWDLGGLRWTARGNKVLRMRCAGCGSFTGHDVQHRS
jgi:uncharacterized Zn finger protein